DSRSQHQEVQAGPGRLPSRRRRVIRTPPMMEERVQAAVKDAYGFLSPDATLQEMRTAYDGISRKLPDGVELRDDEIAAVPVRWLSPTNLTSPKVVVLFHGGGYQAGSVRSHRDLAAHIALAGNATALVVDYRLAPEHLFPAALDDLKAVYAELL